MGNNYEAITQQLEHETAQERSHIHAFYKINFQTYKALLGKQTSISPKNKWYEHNWLNLQFSNYQSSILGLITKMMLKDKEEYYSQYLTELKEENKPISTSTNGFFNGFRGSLSDSMLHFLALNWGSSPFLACNFYTMRYMANLSLKNHEYAISVYYKKLHKQNKFVPVPTAISHYHFLDEAFHTTTSLFLARNLHKHFPKPTAYEKFIANVAVYLSQRENLSQLSGILPNRYIDDSELMLYIYKLLKSPLFDMTAAEALHWMEKCLCHEHEGFHANIKLHQSLLSDLRRFATQLDYLWPINREMRLMAEGTSINKAIKNNTKAFKKFSKFLASQKH